MANWITDSGITRRSFLKRAGLAALVASAATDIWESHGEEPVPYSSGTEPPRFQLPPNACDCHMHIYDSRFPVAPNAALRPPDARVDDYHRLQKRLGTARTVIVQPSTYGTDNRCTLDALAEMGGAARAIAVVDTTVSNDELKRLAGLGIRGIRFNLVQAGATTIEMLEPLSKRVHELGLHVQLHMLGDQIVENASLLQRLPSPIVFDHMARIPLPGGPNHPAFPVVRKLIDQGQTWIKLSGAYQISKTGAPYADMVELGRAYVQAAPERMVWGTDWPHPTMRDAKPDDAVLTNLLAEWAPDEAVRNRILVDNAAELYGFAKG